MQTREIQRLEHIDALRGLAVLGVIALHCSYYSKPFYNAVNTLIQQGSSGVQLFYVISAFTLFLSLSMRKKLEASPTRNFFIRRFFRIAPLFYCAVVFYLLRDGLGPREFLGDAPSITPANILATITFTNGFYPYWINSVVPGGWSVAVEMLFYLFVPLAYRRIKSLDAAVTFTLVSLVISVLISSVGSHFVLISDRLLWNQFLYFWLPNQVPIFGLGFVLFFLYERIKQRIGGISQQIVKARILLGITAFLCLTLPFGGYKFIPTHFLYGLAFVTLTISLSLHPFKFLVNPFTKYLGKISYSAYLTHFAMLPLARFLVEKGATRLPALFQYLVTFVLVVLGTMIVSSITFQLVESPGQNLGRLIITGLEKRRIRSIPEVTDAAI